MKQLTILLTALFMTSISLWATNIQIGNIAIVERNDAEEYVIVEFDLSWDYSFRVDDGANTNWDAAWLFMKYKKVEDNNVQWGHATLNSNGHTVPGNYSSTVAVSGGVNKGIFVYPSVVFANTATINDLRLRWNYGDDGLLPEDSVDVRVFGVEMVYVPQGSFYVGSGGSEGSRFHAGGESNTTPFLVTNATFQIDNSAGNLWATGNRQTGGYDVGYPTGYNAFYMMKHGVTQQAYVDFINTLTYAQQDSLLDGSPSDAAGTYTNDQYRNKIKIQTPGSAGTSPAVYETENQWVPVNYIAPEDLLSYLDWAALRPYTELEYEKAARGPASPVPNEFAWGSRLIGYVTAVSDLGLATEQVVPTTYQRDIIIDHSKVDEDLDSFPILVRLTDLNFDFNKCRADGHDFRFSDVNGNNLKFQRERHDFAAKVAEYWVNVPRVSSSENTTITLTYGNLTDADAADPLATWNQNFVSVWHMLAMSDGTADEFKDARELHDGQGVTPFPNRVEGQISYAQDFNGQAAITVPYAATLDLEDSVTISAWIKPQALFEINNESYTDAHWNTNHSVDNVDVSGNSFTLSDFVSGTATRIAEPIALDQIRRAGSSVIDWNATLGYKIEAFTDDGTFVVPEGVTEVDVLVVAGGGGGGGNAGTGTGGGGGGAGGLVWDSAYTVIPGASIAVSVGAGGAGGASDVRGDKGENSAFGSLVANGGGAGDTRGTESIDWIAGSYGDGGSGGGSNYAGIEPHVFGVGIVGQGHNGGTGNQNGNGQGGGGGGAGTPGANGISDDATNRPSGGDGLYYGHIFGDTYGDAGWFSGGGGGGGADNAGVALPGLGGQGGGGYGGGQNTENTTGPAPGVVNTGGGGGGAGGSVGAGADGGSGIVLLRYKDPNSVRVFTAVSDSDTEGYPGMQVFTANGTFTVPSGITEVEVLVVGGGGAGGDHTSQSTSTAAGGGGGGGVVHNTEYTVTPGDNITVEVGAGGNIVVNNRGESGSNSVFGTIIAEGGGGGGYRQTGNGAPGGSGGGAGYQGSPGIANGAQGYDGGNDYEANPYLGGGGGGAGSVGLDALSTVAGHGGDGLPFYLRGELSYYGGGGGGGAGVGLTSSARGLGGLGGGGNGGYDNVANATDGLPNTGGGGGGAGQNGSSAGAGGSGIVIVRWGKEATPGDPIPVITEGDDLSGKYLWVMQELNSTNSIDPPVFDSISLQIKGESVLLGKGKDAYQLEYFDGKLKAYVDSSLVEMSSDLTMDDYQHVAFTFDGLNQRLFVNGLLVGTSAYSDSIATNTNDLLIGANLDGELDELRLSSVARSGAWIKAERHSGLGDLVQIGGEGNVNNAVYRRADWDASGSGHGPLRVGFGATPTSSRTASGASYWGIMELSGNLYEMVVNAGRTVGKSYTGLHGDGLLNVEGSFDVPNWSPSMGRRGGYFWDWGNNTLRVSERGGMSENGANASERHEWQGGRGVRTAP